MNIQGIKSDSDLVSLLKALTELAETGEIIGIALIAMDKSCETRRFVLGEEIQPGEMLAQSLNLTDDLRIYWADFDE